MTNHVIYSDENMKVEIDGLVHYFLEQTQPKWVELTEQDFTILLNIIISILKSTRNFSKDIKKRLIRAIPVIKSGVGIKLMEPYDGFNEILSYLSLYSDLDFNINQIMSDINDCFQDRGLYCYIFPQEIYGVKGFIVQKEALSQTILLFGFNKRNRNLDFLENL